MKVTLTEVAVFRERVYCDPPCEAELLVQTTVLKPSGLRTTASGLHKCSNGHSAILDKNYPRLVYVPKEVTDEQTDLGKPSDPGMVPG